MQNLFHGTERIGLRTTKGEVYSLSWRDVMEVTAWKEDLLTVDRICLGFETEQEFLRVTEDHSGWKVLIRMLPRYLPGFPTVEEWYREVMLPPFDPCETVLYRRHKEKGEG